MREPDPQASPRSSDAELLDAARAGETARGHAGDPRGRYAHFQARFEREQRMDAHGLHQAVLDLRSPSAIDPPVPPTLRGRLGHWIVRGQARFFWWLPRAFNLQTRAIAAAYETLRAEHRRVTLLEEKYAAAAAAFEKRLRKLETRARTDAGEDETD